MDNANLETKDTVLSAFLRGVGWGSGCVAVLALVFLFVPGVQETLERIATTCFG